MQNLYFVGIPLIISVLFFFAVGVALSFRSSAILAGSYIGAPFQGKSNRWIAFGIITILCLIGDFLTILIIEHAGYTLSELLHFVTLGILNITTILSAIGLLQISGLVKFFHTEKRLSAHYEAVRIGTQAPTKFEQYVLNNPNSLLASIMELLYTLFRPWRDMWPYISLAVGWKAVVFLMHTIWGKFYALPFILGGIGLSFIKGSNLDYTVTDLWNSYNSLYQFGDVFLISSLVAGYLFGHIAFHKQDELKDIKRNDVYQLVRIVLTVFVALATLIVLFVGSIIFLLYR